MCNNIKKIVFCSCEKIENKLTGTYQWSLYRYLGSRPSRLLGIIRRPDKDLGNQITVDKVLKEMNMRNCFDFEYVPKERDTFHINNGKRPNFKSFSLIFKNGKWVEGNNPSFGRTISENIARGNIKME